MWGYVFGATHIKGEHILLWRHSDKYFCSPVIDTVTIDTICRVSSTYYFFLFFEPVPIFSYFLTKTSYFSYFLACEAKICSKIENGIIVVCVLEWDLW